MLAFATYTNQTVVIPSGILTGAIGKFFDLSSLRAEFCVVDKLPANTKGDSVLELRSDDYFYYQNHDLRANSFFMAIVMKLLFGNPHQQLRRAHERFIKQHLTKPPGHTFASFGYASAHQRDMCDFPASTGNHCLYWASGTTDDEDICTLPTSYLKRSFAHAGMPWEVPKYLATDGSGDGASTKDFVRYDYKVSGLQVQ
jgi:hypothetical protein